MVTRQISYVDIQERDDFDDLLRSLQRYAGSTLTVDVASDIEALSEPGEFEMLFSSAQDYDIRIELVTDDPVRQELARLHGMKAVPDSKPVNPRFDPLATTMIVAQQPIIERDPADIEVTQEYSLDDVGEAEWDRSEQFSPFDSDASFSFVTAPPTAVRSRASAVQRKHRTVQRQSVSRSLGSGSIVVSVAAVAIAVAVLLIALLAPSAAVVIVPETRPVAAQVTYGLTGSGESLDVAVTPTHVTETLTFKSSVPTTGEAFVPDTPASGMIFLTNPDTEVVTLPVGTVFTVEGSELSYVSIDAIDIPAADPFGSARFGTAVVGIKATEPGPAGNLDTGQLSGTLESGIMFQNRFPLEGGAMKSVGVVNQQDLEALRALAGQDLGGRVSSALSEQIPEGWKLVESPKMASDIEATFSAEAGAIAETVSVQAAVEVAGDIYDPAALENQARDRLLDSMTAAVPDGFGLVVDSIRLSAPQDAGANAHAISAEGTAEAQLPRDFADRLKEELVGKSEDSAVQVLQRFDGIEEFTVQYGPSWLPWEPVPRLSNRVSIEIDGT